VKFYAQIISGKILPEHDSDYEQFKKLRSGVTYRFEIVKERNYEFHKKFFALLNLAFLNQETFDSFDDFRSWAIMKAGYYKRIKTPGDDLFLPESISFSSMDELEFQELYSKIMDVICGFLDLSKEEIQREVVNFL
jgi:hypothetical protein